MNWREKHAEQQRDAAFKELGLEMGQRVWYWNQHQDIPSQWVTAYVCGGGGKDGYPVIDVEIEDAEGWLPDYYRGFGKWGYGWQIRPYTEERPDPPTNEEMYP
jgi:hypothetical protein